MPRLFALNAALGLALLFAGSRPAAAAPPATTTTPPASTATPPSPQPVALATGETDPFTFSWLDAADGTTGTDSDLATQIHDVLSDTTYLILDNQQILIGQVKNNQLNPTFTVNERHDSKGTFYVMHALTKNGKAMALVDGSITRSTQDPTQGFAVLTLHLFDEQGNIGTTYVEQVLQFQKLTSP